MTVIQPFSTAVKIIVLSKMELNGTGSREIWISVLLSITFWCAFYLLITYIVPDKSPEYYSRILTLFHGLYVTIYGVSLCSSSATKVFEQPDAVSSYEQSFLLAVSLGYFMQDLLWCLYYQTETRLMVVHHIYSCIALWRLLIKRTSGALAVCGIAGLELTNPFLQARWFLRTYGHRDNAWFIATEIIFMILFFIVRIVLGSLYLFFIFTETKNSWEFTILCSVIYGVSWLFMINIAKYVSQRYLQAVIEAEIDPSPSEGN